MGTLKITFFKKSKEGEGYKENGKWKQKPSTYLRHITASFGLSYDDGWYGDGKANGLWLKSLCGVSDDTDAGINLFAGNFEGCGVEGDIKQDCEECRVKFEELE